MKKLLLYLILVAVAGVAFLFSPKPESKGPNAACPQQYISLNKYMGIPVNCDEFTFIGAAIEPDYLLQQNFIRQSRPLYILSGTVAGYGVYYISYPFHKQIEKAVAGKFTAAGGGKNNVLHACVYAGFILLNIFILLVTLWLFNWLLVYFSGKWKNGKWLLLLLFLALITNHVTRNYFWVAHQQMLNIMAPLFCLYAAVKVADKKNWQQLLLFSAAGGMLLLFYGNFLFMLPLIVISYFVNNNLTVKEKAFHAGLAIVLFFIPLIAWIEILQMRGVEFYSYETTVFRQFVWIKDAWQQGNVLQTTLKNTIDLATTLFTLLMPALLVVVAYFLKGKKITKNKYWLIGLTAAIIFIFLLLLGYYADRITYSLAPLLFLYAGIYLNNNKLSKTQENLVLTLLIIFFMLNIFLPVPLHLSDKLFYQ